MATKTMVLPVAEWTPDMPDYNSPGSAYIHNCVPRTPQSYGPLSGLSVYSGSALNKRCQGMAAYLDPTGNVFNFAGDQNDLYTLTGTGTVFQVASKSVGAYNCQGTDMWNFTMMGSTVLAANISDNMQAFQIGVGTGTTFMDVGNGAPKAKYLAVVKNFLVAAFTSDPANGIRPQRIWWSGLNNYANWPTPGTASAAIVMSDYNDLLGDGGWIYGLVGNLGTADGAIFMENAVWRMMFNGPPGVFNFIPAEGVRGTQAPNSIVQFSNVVFYLGRDGFYMFDGTNSTPIGANKVDKWFFQNVDQSNLTRVVGAVDPINKLVHWAWPDSAALNGNPNHLLTYNWILSRWAYSDVTVETLGKLLSIGYTLDQMNIFGTFDSMPQIPLDSRYWTGGKDILAAMDTNHKLNYFSGSNLLAVIDTSEVAPVPGRICNIKGARPLVDGGVPLVAIGARNLLTAASSLDTAVAMNSLGTAPQRSTGRYIKAEITIPAGTVWNHCQGVEVDFNESGIR